MAAVNDILIRTAVAAVSTDSRLRVYETAVDGGIRETQYEGSWTGGTSGNVIANGKIGTPVTAASLGDFDRICIYYIGTDNNLREECSDGGGAWYNGDLSQAGFAVAPYSSVAAFFLGGQNVVRVYGQVADNTIQEWCWNNDGKGWVGGSNLGPALPGSQITVTSWVSDGSNHVRVYAQDANLNIFEKAWDGPSGWYTGALAFSCPVVRTALAATSWVNTSTGVVSVRVFYGASPGNVVREKVYENALPWFDGELVYSTIPATNIAVLPWPALHVYLQVGTKDTAVSELTWVNNKWVVTNPALPPAEA